MRAVAIMVMGALAAGLLQGQKGTEGKSGKSEVSATVAGEVGAKLDEQVKSVDRAEGGPSGNVLVSVGGKVLLEKGYGIADANGKKPMPTDALWDWASVSKQFTAAAVLTHLRQLRDLDGPRHSFSLGVFVDRSRADVKV
jgi:CubicO group peptidase (beta-lactamase class C family)